MTWISKRASIVSLPEHLHDPNALDWESLGWIELNPAPGTAQMFGKSRIKMNELDQIKWKQWMESRGWNGSIRATDHVQSTKVEEGTRSGSYCDSIYEANHWFE
eukprot:1024680_1